MTIRTTVTASLVAAVLGLLLYAWSSHWIVINFPTNQIADKPTLAAQSVLQKTIQLHFFKDFSWRHEKITVALPAQPATQLQLILNKLCFLLEEEKIISSSVQIESIAYTADESELLLSCTKNPFADCTNIYEKMMLLETFLKTIQSNTKSLVLVRFLLFHEPLADDHINFDVAFPSTGYLEKQ